MLYYIICSILYSYIDSLGGPKADGLYSSLGPPSVNKVIIIILLLLLLYANVRPIG